MERIIEDMQPYAYWLDNVFGIGDKTAVKLLKLYETAQNIYEEEEKRLSGYLNKTQAETMSKSRKSWNVQEEYEKLAHAGITFFPAYHPNYPSKLLAIPDKPFAVYVKGRLPQEHRPSVAVIGARQCSEYGRFIAKEFAGALAVADIQVISGLAAGIDGLSQQAAVAAKGDTYAVLGCGVDICYPAAHKVLYEQIIQTGGILSTYLPGTTPKAALFPPRNRIISGLSDVLLVVEARQKSGTLITVDMALEQGKEVFVIPGRLTDRLSDGCNRLIRQGAGIALSPDDFVQEVISIAGRQKKYKEWQITAGVKLPCKGEQKIFHELNQKEKSVLDLLDLSPISMDELRQKMHENPMLKEITIQETMHILLRLVVLDLAEQAGGNYYVRKGDANR